MPQKKYIVRSQPRNARSVESDPQVRPLRVAQRADASNADADSTAQGDAFSHGTTAERSPTCVPGASENREFPRCPWRGVSTPSAFGEYAHGAANGTPRATVEYAQGAACFPPSSETLNAEQPVQRGRAPMAATKLPARLPRGPRPRSSCLAVVAVLVRRVAGPVPVGSEHLLWCAWTLAGPWFVVSCGRSGVGLGERRRWRSVRAVGTRGVRSSRGRVRPARALVRPSGAGLPLVCPARTVTVPMARCKYALCVW